MAGSEPSLRVVKSFPFKGGTRLWSNRYYFLGGVPADDTHWHTLMDNVTTAEKAIFPSATTIVEALGYAASSDVPVSTKTYSLTGTHTESGGTAPCGESAALIRYSTAARSTKNHPIYCFNYYHGVDNVGGAWATADQLLASIRTSMGTYAASWISGFSDGTHTLTRCSPAGHAATGSIVEEYLTHRDFPYTTSV